MQINRLMAFFLFAALGYSHVAQAETIPAQQALHDYGIAYCLSHGESYQQEAHLAMGGYFQMGEHEAQAYRDVQTWIDQQLKQGVGSYQNVHLPAYLMACLQISHLPAYVDLIKRLGLDVEENHHLLHQ